MALLALLLFTAFSLLTGVVRVIVHHLSTGDSGIRRARAVGPVHKWARAVLLAGSQLVGVAAPVAELLGFQALSIMDIPELRAAGAVLAGLSTLAVFAAQYAMGGSWRDDVDPNEHTALVTGGPFRIVRNPIYTAALFWAAGLVLLVPNLLSVSGLALLMFGLELQVRRVEEPCMRSTHGSVFQQYAAGVGRFLPRVGRLLD